VHDTATLSGGTAGFSFDGTATVTYSLYSTNDCTTPPAATTENVTVTAGGLVPNSAATAPLGAGDHSYRAVYNGNANYNPATGACEPFKVAKGTPSISTVVKDAGGATVDNANPAVLGSQVHDTATLSGGTAGFSLDGNATVTYSFFLTNDCTTPPAATTENVTVSAGGLVPNSSPTAPLAAGKYSYRAVYNGNSNYNPAIGDCEPFALTAPPPSITTVVKDAGGTTVDNANPAALGAQVHDTTTLTGGAALFSLGDGATVTYRFYLTNDCTAPPATTENVTVTAGGAVPNSSPTVPLTPGSYSYRAVYNGNTNYNTATGDCEPFKVAKGTPSISTVVKDAGGTTVDNANPAALGSQVHDTATLSGGTAGFSFDGTATVTYSLYTTNNCTTPPAATTQNVTVTAGGVVPNSSATGPLAAGDYSYRAVYSGNANYDPATGACEPFKVAKGTPSLSTVVRDAGGAIVDNANPAVLGSQLHDTAILSGATTGFSLNASAAVTYRLYQSNDCSTVAATSEDVIVSAAGAVPDSSASAPSGAGSYSYRATYNGNANYSPAMGACEPFKVSKGTPLLTTVVKDAGGTTVDNANPAAAGSQVHDTAMLSGSTAGFSLNGSTTVTYRFYGTNTCTTPPVATSENVTVGASGTVPNSSPTAALAAGGYSYRATYNGNANYNAVTGDCEPFMVKTLEFGKLEICKSTANGMAGRTFAFSVNGGSPISVKGGRCTGAFTAVAGANRITELQTNPATEVSTVGVRPSTRLVSLDAPNRTAMVSVIAGSTASNETMVTFTNAPSGGVVGDLKICKLTQAPAYLGRLFSFRVNGGSLFSTPANAAQADPGTWTCRIAGTFPTGSVVAVQEDIPTGAEIDFIDTLPGANLVDFDTEAGTADVKITGPVTTVLYDNEPIPPPQAGWIEVCKDALGGDPFVVGAFDFTISPPDGNSFDATTFAGQCTAPFKVAAGIVHVTEHAKANHSLVDVTTLPSSRLLFTNLANGTADVEVPVGDVSTETQVHFVNQRDRAALKVCKTLGASSGALVGATFNFSVTSPGLPTQSADIAAAATTQCLIVGQYPVGNDVTVVENLDHGAGQPGQYIDTTGGGTITIAPGVNQVDFTNTARGVIQLCKVRIDYLTGTQPTFRFRIDGGALLAVQAGKCSPAIRVAPGPHTITELAEPDYELVGIAAVPANWLLLADLANRTATIDVPYAGAGNGETAVQVTNRVRQGQIKICKAVPQGSLDALFGVPFGYDVLVQNNDGTTPPAFTMGPISAKDGCTLPSAPFPILNQNGSRKAVGIHEQGAGQAATFNVTAIAITSGGRGLCHRTDPGVNQVICPYVVGQNPDLVNGNIDFYLGPDINEVRYTNQAK
jgi:hypothetical protein